MSAAAFMVTKSGQTVAYTLHEYEEEHEGSTTNLINGLRVYLPDRRNTRRYQYIDTSTIAWQDPQLPKTYFLSSQTVQKFKTCMQKRTPILVCGVPKIGKNLYVQFIAKTLDFKILQLTSHEAVGLLEKYNYDKYLLYLFEEALKQPKTIIYCRDYDLFPRQFQVHLQNFYDLHQGTDREIRLIFTTVRPKTIEYHPQYQKVVLDLPNLDERYGLIQALCEDRQTLQEIGNFHHRLFTMLKRYIIHIFSYFYFADIEECHNIAAKFERCDAKGIKRAFKNAVEFHNNVSKYRKKKLSLWQRLQCTNPKERLNETQILLRQVEAAYFRYGIGSSVTNAEIEAMREYAKLYQHISQ